MGSYRNLKISLTTLKRLCVTPANKLEDNYNHNKNNGLQKGPITTLTIITPSMTPQSKPALVTPSNMPNHKLTNKSKVALFSQNPLKMRNWTSNFIAESSVSESVVPGSNPIMSRVFSLTKCSRNFSSKYRQNSIDIIYM